ncbi:MAG TPA: protein kinase [Gemmatimonadaceae bacterium]|nr:protein kinase [Gemmatimonadaceae bacterium]
MDADAPRSARDPSGLSGRQVSHFRILEPLGAGGMGVVYRAEDLRLHRTVALKFMRPDYTLNDTATARFLREARSVAALDHPNVCTIHEVGETEDGQLFLAMSHYPGETLRDRLAARGPLAVGEALDIASQIARGLVCAHGAGIVHRDLKPANVMLTADGTVKILDFGLAKTRDQSMTTAGAVMGTIAYMAPEQLVGDPVDARSDLWSLGVVLFEMLTGRHPSRTDDATGTLTRHVAAHHAPAVRLESSAALARLLERLLRKDPAERYQRADEVLTDLTALREQITAPLAGSARRGGLTRARAVAAGVAVLVLAAASFVVVQWRRATAPGDPSPPTSLAVLPLKNFSGPDQEYFADGMTDELTSTLAKIEALRVIANQSMLQFKRSAHPVPEIARMLGVKYLVDGSVRTDSSRIRIRASLINAAGNTPVWSQDFDEERRDVMALQRNVALAIARAVEVTLTPQDTSRLAARPPVDPQAFDLYLKGTQARHDASFTGDFRESTRLLEEAIAHDSAFANPYAGLALNYAWTLDEARARRMADTAIALDPTLADAYVARAIISQYFDWDWDGADNALRKAIELNPGHAEARHERSMLWSRLGRYDEALREARLALENAPTSLRFENGLAEVYLFGGEPEKALEIADGIARKDSTFLGPDLVRAVAYIALGRYDEAERAWRRCRRVVGDRCPHSVEFAYVHAKTRPRSDASKLIDSLETRWRQERANRSAWSIAESVAMAYAGLGERDSATVWLERAAELRTQMLYIKVHPAFASLRSEPRYQRLLERMGFPDDQGAGRAGPR